MLLKPPLDSVPHLMRPVAADLAASSAVPSNFFQVPSRTVPSRYAPVTKQLVIVTLSGGAVVAEGKAGLRTDAIVPRGVNGAVRDADVLAAVDVHAIAVGVDLEVVDGEVVDAREQKAEVAAFEDGEVAEE